MREIITISVGQCGNQIGQAFWKTIAQEHQLTNDGQCLSNNSILKDNLNVYFNETSQRYIPRAILVDLESGVLDNIRQSNIGKLFKPDNYSNAYASAGNNWGAGFYTAGAEQADEVVDLIRRESEQAESIQGFQFIHSLGGGSGSGFGTLLISKMKEEFSDKMLSTFSVFPSPKTSDVVVEPYNATLSIHQLIENTEEVFTIDNEALFDICTKQLKISNPSFDDLNQLVADVMSGVTSSLRFPGQLNSDLRKLAVNLVPFPRLHFFLTSNVPITSNLSSNYQQLTVSELTNQMFSKKNVFAACDPSQGKYLAASAIFRGENISTREVDTQMALIQSKFSNYFVPWIPNNIKSSICNVAPKKELPISGTFIANTTAIQEVFKRIAHQFHQMFKKKAFIYSYIDQGMDEMEFTEAEANLNDLINEYIQYQEATIEDDYGGNGDENVEEQMEP
ncbi:hypothetical protein ABK040_007088 [Willaertia magna]